MSAFDVVSFADATGLDLDVPDPPLSVQGGVGEAVDEVRRRVWGEALEPQGVEE